MKRSAFLTAVVTTVLVVVLPFFGGGGPGLLTSPVAAVSGTAASSAASTALVVPATVGVADLPRAAIGSVVTVTDPVVATAGAAAGYEDAGFADAGGGDAAPEVSSEGMALAYEWEQAVFLKPVQKPTPAGGTPTSTRVVTGATAGQTCPQPVTGTVGTAPKRISPMGVTGTTSDDLATFAYAYNAIRVANCLKPIPLANFRYDQCMEDRLFWMAESPSEDPADAWGHIGTVRIDGVPSVGCDGNLAGGYGNTGSTVAGKWWNSSGHRDALYRPTSTANLATVCIYLAMTHGGVPNEPYEFVRAAARWGTC